MEKQSGLLSGTKGSLSSIGMKGRFLFSLSPLPLWLVPVLPDHPLDRSFSLSWSPKLPSSSPRINPGSLRQLEQRGRSIEAVLRAAVSFYCIHYSDLQKGRLAYLRLSSVEIFIKGEKMVVWGWNLLAGVCNLCYFTPLAQESTAEFKWGFLSPQTEPQLVLSR